MMVSSTRFEALESIDIPDDNILVFPEGMPGFDGHSRFALIEDERFPRLSWLQSLHQADIVFMLVDPSEAVPDYGPTLEDQDLDCLELAEQDAMVDLRCIGIVWRDEHRITANLRAPIVVNRHQRLAKQVILSDDK